MQFLKTAAVQGLIGVKSYLPDEKDLLAQTSQNDVKKGGNSEVNRDIKFKFERLHNSIFKRLGSTVNSQCGAPIETILTALLVALGGTIGKKAHIKFTRKIILYPVIWAIIIGPSGRIKKTTALDICTDEIADISEEKYLEYKAAKARYEELLAGLSSAEDRLSVPKPERNDLIISEDFTPEALADRLDNANKGFIKISEMGYFFAQFQRKYSAGTKELLTQLFDVPKNWGNMRATKGEKAIKRPFISIIGASTKYWIRKYLKDEDLLSGFSARFLYCIKDFCEKPFTPLVDLEENDLDSDTILFVHGIFQRLANIINDKEMKFQLEAKNLYRDYEIAMERKISNLKNPIEGAFYERLKQYAAKFAMIIALTNDHDMITLEDMEDAILIADFYGENLCRFINGDILENVYQETEEKIYNLIAREEAGIEHSKLLRNLRISAKILADYIRNLEEKNLISIHRNSSNGKKSSLRYEAIKNSYNMK